MATSVAFSDQGDIKMTYCFVISNIDFGNIHATSSLLNAKEELVEFLDVQEIDLKQKLFEFVNDEFLRLTIHENQNNGTIFIDSDLGNNGHDAKIEFFFSI